MVEEARLIVSSAMAPADTGTIQPLKSALTARALENKPAPCVAGAEKSRLARTIPEVIAELVSFIISK